jgi:uncharacterized repeat protein (TIGR01451 family)
MRYVRILALVALCLAYAPTPALAVTGYDSAYSGESAFVNINPGETASFQVFFSNTGTLTWTKGGDTQVDLAACLADKVTCPAQDPTDSTWNSGWLSATRYATATQASVAPGTIATFAYNIKAPSDATGTHRFNGDLVVSSSGERIHPEGYYQDATIPAIGNIPLPTPTPQPPVVIPPQGTPTADLAITKTDSPDPVNPGTNLTYTLTASNGGGFNAQNVMVTDVLPANTTFVSFTAPAGWTATTGSTVTATTANMPPASAATFTLVVKVSPQASDESAIQNTATITSATSDPNPANNTATASTNVQTAADLSVTKSDSPDPVFAGFNVTYTITADNAGPNAAQNVELTDMVPSGTTFVSFDQTSGPDIFDWNSLTVGGMGTVTVTTSTFDTEESATFRLVVKVNPSFPAGSAVNNTADISSNTSDPNENNNGATATTTVQSQSLLCFDGTSDTAAGQTGDQIYGGVCTLTGSRSATLNNVPPGRNGEYSGVYFDPSALTGETVGQITALSFAYTGNTPEGNGPRITLPIDTDGVGGTDFYITIDARDCTTGGVVDIHNASCTIWKNTDGTTPVASNWASLVATHPQWRVSSTASANGGTTPFIIADGVGAWNLSDVHMGN